MPHVPVNQRRLQVPFLACTGCACHTMFDLTLMCACAGRWALDRKMLEQKYINQTEKFYDKYGGKTVVLARFVPIVRTFAPFVAGIGSMTYSK